MAKKTKKYYAVAVGRKPGIYTDWFGPNGAEAQIKGFPQARYKGFSSRQEAEDFLKNKGKSINQSRLKPTSNAEGSKRTQTPPKKTSDFDRITIYTDGGCINNPGPGGYGVVIKAGDKRKELSGGFRLTTNNRMELTACIVALGQFRKKSKVTLHSDSKYVVDGITKGWAKRWQSNGWMRTKSDPAINPDLWDKLLALYEKHDVEFVWVKGHAGNPENERCDALANIEAVKTDLPADEVYEQL